MMNFSCMEDLMKLSESSRKSIADIIVEYEAEHSLKSDISVKQKERFSPCGKRAGKCTIYPRSSPPGTGGGKRDMLGGSFCGARLFLGFGGPSRNCKIMKRKVYTY